MIWNSKTGIDLKSKLSVHLLTNPWAIIDNFYVHLQLHTLKVCAIRDFNAFRCALIDFMIWYGSKRSYMKHMLWCVNQFHTLQFAPHLKCSYLAVKKVWSFRGFFLWQLFVDSTYVLFICSIIILLKGSGTLDTLRSMKL